MYLASLSVRMVTRSVSEGKSILTGPSLTLRVMTSTLANTKTADCRGSKISSVLEDPSLKMSVTQSPITPSPTDRCSAYFTIRFNCLSACSESRPTWVILVPLTFSICNSLRFRT